jgi:hypothetical protein
VEGGGDLDDEGGHNVLGVDEAWDSQVLDARFSEDLGAGVKPCDMVGSVQELRDHHAQGTQHCLHFIDRIKESSSL